MNYIILHTNHYKPIFFALPCVNLGVQEVQNLNIGISKSENEKNNEEIK